jgi:hypothetical protein
MAGSSTMEALHHPTMEMDSACLNIELSYDMKRMGQATFGFG